MPQAPIFASATSGRAASQAWTARVSAISRGPSIETRPPGLPVPARVEGQDDVALPDEAVAPRRARSSPLCSAGESVQEHERRPAAGGRGAVGQVERGRDGHAVVHRDGHVLLGEGGAGGVPDEAGRERRRDPESRSSPRPGRVDEECDRRPAGGQSTRCRRRIPRMDSRPIGVFDSGMGGLTVLHECLVTLPHEDFVYLGDGARLPYGPRPLEEIRRFAAEIAGYLERQGVKLIVAACNSATAAALPGSPAQPLAARRRRARARRRTPPCSRRATAASGSSRPRRRSRAAATRSSCGALDAGAEVVPGRLPPARAADRGARPLRRGDGERRARVRGAAQGSPASTP